MIVKETAQQRLKKKSLPKRDQKALLHYLGEKDQSLIQIRLKALA